MSESWSSVLELLAGGRQWYKGEYTNETGTSFCVLGACGMAWSGDSESAGYLDWLAEHDKEFLELGTCLIEKGYVTTDVSAEHAIDVVTFVGQWNDDEKTTWKHVEDVLVTLVVKEITLVAV